MVTSRVVVLLVHACVCFAHGESDLAKRVAELEALVAAQARMYESRLASLEERLLERPPHSVSNGAGAGAHPSVDGGRQLATTEAEESAAISLAGVATIAASGSSGELAVAAPSFRVNSSSMQIDSGRLRIAASDASGRVHVDSGDSRVSIGGEHGLEVSTGEGLAAHAHFKISGHTLSMQGVNNASAYVHVLPYIEWKNSASHPTEPGKRAMYFGWGSTDPAGSKYVGMGLENGFALGITGGRVGIGTAEPEALLHVDGSARVGELSLGSYLNLHQGAAILQGVPACADPNRGQIWSCHSSNGGGCPESGYATVKPCASHNGMYHDHVYICLRQTDDDYKWVCVA
jgi:hypothetical protein